MSTAPQYTKGDLIIFLIERQEQRQRKFLKMIEARLESYKQEKHYNNLKQQLWQQK